MSVTFRLDNGEGITLPLVSVLSSVILKELISNLGIKADIELSVPSQFTSTLPLYTDFLFGHNLDVSNVKELLLLFELEGYYEDKSFFVYLMSEAYKFWKQFLPYLHRLNDREMYLYTPYEFIPSSLRDQPVFFETWLEINKNSKVVLDDSKVHRTRLTYYKDSQQRKKLKIYHNVNGKKIGRSYEMTWYENGQLQSRRNYKDDMQDGLQEEWYANGQLRS